MKIEQKTPTEVFTAQVENDAFNYPGIRIEANGNLATAIEHCIGDGTDQVMIRIYTKENEEPISVNWRTGKVTLPEDWKGEIKIEKP